MLICGIAIYTGCNIPEQPSNLHVISGYLYEDCSMTPSANHYVDLYQQIEGGFGGNSGGLLTNGYTDSNGYFKLTYEPDGHGFIRLRDESLDLLVDIPPNEDSAEVVVYRHPTCNIQVSLNVLNPHEAGDTLVIGDYRTFDNLNISCPVYSGLLYIAENVPLLAMFYNGEIKYINWFFTPYNDNSVLQEFTIDKYCNDTINVIVDIY